MVAGSSLFRRSCSNGWVVGGVVVLFVLVGFGSLVCFGSKIRCLFVRVLQFFFIGSPFLVGVLPSRLELVCDRICW